MEIFRPFPPGRALKVGFMYVLIQLSHPALFPSFLKGMENVKPSGAVPLDDWNFTIKELVSFDIGMVEFYVKTEGTVEILVEKQEVEEPPQKLTVTKKKRKIASIAPSGSSRSTVTTPAPIRYVMNIVRMRARGGVGKGGVDVKNYGLYLCRYVRMYL